MSVSHPAELSPQGVAPTDPGWFERFARGESWPRWMVEPFRQPAILLSLAAGAALLSGLTIAPQGLTVGGILAGLIALGLAWPWVALRGASAELRCERTRATEGEVVRWRLTVANRWPFPLWGLALRGGWQDSAEAEPAGLATVAPCSVQEFVIESRPECRGSYPLSPPELATGFPFGLWTATSPARCDERLLVWPRRLRLAAAPFAADRGANQAVPHEIRAGDEGDRVGTRPYRPGDSLRNVHWAITARFDRLIVCERQLATRAHVEVAVDARQRAHRGGGAGGSLAWALRVAASILQSLDEQGAEVALRLGTRRLAASRRGGLAPLWDALAEVPPAGLSDVSLPAAPRARGPRPLTILVTTDLGMAPAEWGSRGDERAIVLHAAAFDRDPADATSDDSGSSAGAWLWVAGPEQLSDHFTRAWEQACDDAWCGQS